MSSDNDRTPDGKPQWPYARSRPIRPDATIEGMHKQLEGPYRASAVIWIIYSAALGFTSLGSQLLAFAETFRIICLALAILSGVVMVLRLFTPGHPEWSRWTLLLNATAFLSTFVLSLFASEMAGGLTTSRIGYSLLLLGCAFTAYLNWFGERIVWEP